MSDNVVGLFYSAAARHPERTAFVYPDGDASARISFGQLQADAEAFAGGLSAHGFGAGERAVFVLPMSPALYVAVLGVLSTGGTAVFVDPWVPMRQIARLMAAAHPSAFVGTPKAHLLRLLEPALRRIRLTISTEGFGARWAARLRFSDLRGARGPASADADAPALITFTTGSSGTPKGVTRTHAILEAQHHVIREEFPARDGDVDLTTFPVFALSNLAAGVTTVIPPVDLRRVAQAEGERVLRAMRDGGVTTISASPPLIDRLVDRMDATRESPPALRRIVTGGAPVTDAQLRRWSAAFPGTDIQVAYGSSEAEPVARMSASERLAAAGAGFCAGQPVAALRTRVVRITRGPLDAAVALPAHEIGELLVSGPHVCRDYVGDPAAFRENKVRESDGTVWHRMGDTGSFDEAGRFWIAGRVHSTITRAGVHYHPQLVEQQLMDIAGSGAVRAAALGMPDESLGEQLWVAFECATPPTDAARSGLIARIRQTGLPVDNIAFATDAFPLDPRHNSKVDYGQLRERLRAAR